MARLMGHVLPIPHLLSSQNLQAHNGNVPIVVKLATSRQTKSANHLFVSLLFF